MTRNDAAPSASDPTPGDGDQLSKPNRSRLATLWSGGRAAAGVGAGVAIIGFLLVRGVADIPILGSDDGWFVLSMLLYVLGAVALALIATEVMRLLLLGTPRPRTFFAWVAGVVIAVLFLLPLIGGQPLSERIGTAFVNLITSVAIAILVSMSAAAATRRTDVRPKVVPIPSDGAG